MGQTATVAAEADLADPAAFSKSLRRFLEASESLDVRRRFFAAFEDRRQRSWLAESDDDGLVEALASTLGAYVPTRRTSEECEVKRRSGTVDAAAQASLLLATDALVSRPLVAQHFALALRREGWDDLTKLGEPELWAHFCEAFNAYYASRLRGLTPDPW
jgi:hypothetical protein